MHTQRDTSEITYLHDTATSRKLFYLLVVVGGQMAHASGHEWMKSIRTLTSIKINYLK